MANEAYRYQPLPDGPGYMRLLDFPASTSNTDETIACRLKTWRIEDVPPYLAISYTWGSPDATERIVTNGRPMTVRKNCANVLRQVCALPSQSYYWIDAICINQDSIVEKSGQVALMGMIYELAEQVLACVGAEDDDAEYAVEHLAEYEEAHKEAVSGWISKSDNTLFSSWLNQKFPGFWIARFVSAYLQLTKRPYFWRVWIIQELFLARDVLICCGQSRVSLGMLRVAAALFDEGRRRLEAHSLCPKDAYGVPTCGLGLSRASVQSSSHVRCRICGLHDSTTISRVVIKTLHTERFPRGGEFWQLLEILTSASATSVQRQRMSLRDAIYLGALRECEKPRDRIYGMLSLVDWGAKGRPRADYQKPVFNLVKEVLRYGVDIETGLQLVKNMRLNASNTEASHWLDQQPICTTIDHWPQNHWPTTREGMVHTLETSAFPTTRLKMLAHFTDEVRFSIAHKVGPTESDSVVEVRLEKKNTCKAIASPTLKEGDWLLSICRTTLPSGGYLVFGLVLRQNDDYTSGPRLIVGKVIMEADCMDTLGIASSVKWRLCFDPHDFVVLAAQIPKIVAAVQHNSLTDLPSSALKLLNKSVCSGVASSYAIEQDWDARG